jgi:hypothetical protein
MWGKYHARVSNNSMICHQPIHFGNLFYFFLFLRLPVYNAYSNCVELSLIKVINKTVDTARKYSGTIKTEP